MTPTITGGLIGALLALAALQFGFWGFLLVVVLGGIGALVGRVFSGQLDVRGLADVVTGRRTS